MTSRSFAAYDLGRAPYEPTHALQVRLQEARTEGRIGDTVLVLEHPPVITLGRGARTNHVLLDRAALAARGVEVHEIGRGGDVTYHGPGQLVVYPILDLNPDRKDVRRYVASLEEAMIRCAKSYGVDAGRIDGLNGTCIRSGGPGKTDRKIGAVGVRISRWVTMHGLAFNVSTRLEDFRWIVPCGIYDKAVTSLEAEIGVAPPLREVAETLVGHLAGLYQASVTWSDEPPEWDNASAADAKR